MSAGKQPDLLEVTVSKETWDAEAGISFASKGGKVVISDYSGFKGTAKVGSEVVSINGIPCKECLPEDCLEIIGEAEGDITMVVREPPYAYDDPQAVSERGETQPLTKLNSTFMSEESRTTKEESKDLVRKEDSDFVDCQLTEDVYSLIYTASYSSPAFYFSIFVFVFQMTLIALTLWDLLDHFNHETNPLNVPPGAAPQVQAAMALALLLAVATQGDLIAASLLFQQGYSEHALEVIPSATWFKWVLSCFCQFVAGIALLLTIFILVVQSSTVIGMMLNFAALSFMSEIDDGAFLLAKHGFLSDELEKEANCVANIRIPCKKTTSKALRRLLFLVIFAGVMAGYGIIIHQQRNGKFLCQSILLQIGDGFRPQASGFSGIYDQTDELISGRVTYVARNKQQTMLAYCEKENSWTFVFSLEDFNPDLDPCKWAGKSPRTNTFDVTTTSDSTWIIKLDGLRTEPLQTFVLKCVDCHSNSAESRSCGDNGTCVDNQCVCGPGSIGIFCEFTEPCPKLKVDARTKSFPAEFSADFISDEYDLLLDEYGEMVTAYGMLVYVFDHSDFWSIILFTGRRWVATSSLLIGILQLDFPYNPTLPELAGFVKQFHSVYTPVPGAFISDPMDVGTPSNAMTPVGLGWYRTRTNEFDGFVYHEVDQSQQIDSVLLCSICDEFDENGCFNLGICTDQQCVCYEGYGGALCELDLQAGNETDDGVGL